MSATRTAAALIIARGQGTADDILPHMPGHTRAQVRSALKAAADQGLIDSDGRQRQEGRPHRATGKPRGARATVYRKKAPQQQYSQVASVWHYANQEASHG
jgi:hypothetical protein